MLDILKSKIYNVIYLYDTVCIIFENKLYRCYMLFASGLVKIRHNKGKLYHGKC